MSGVRRCPAFRPAGNGLAAGVLYLLLALATSSTISGCADDADPAAPGPASRFPAPAAIGDGWPTDTPAGTGLPEASLLQMLEALEDDPALAVHGIVIAKGGRLVFERYYAGQDVELDMQVPGSGQLVFVPRSFDRETPHFTASSGKSVISLLLGIAIDMQLIAGTDALLFPFFPEYAGLADPLKEQITLGDLLTMRSGLPWDDGSHPIWDPRNDEYQLLFHPDPTAFVLAKPLATAPGTTFEYNSGATYLVAETIERAAGEDIDTFAGRELMEPLGIVDYYWATSHNAHDSVFSGGIYLRPRDMAKLGQLVLEGGVWNGRRIVSESWLATSLARAVDVPAGQSPLPETVDGYGCQWWVGRFGAAAGESYLAIGWGGQFIIVVPEFDLVTVFTSGAYLAPNFSRILGVFDAYLSTAAGAAE